MAWALVPPKPKLARHQLTEQKTQIQKILPVDACSTRAAIGNGWPWCQRCWYVQVVVKRFDARIESVEEKIGRNLLVLQSERCLEQSCDASCAFGVADNGLNAADKHR